MDLRTQKTQRAIREAFLHLRAKKPLERITVKELTELAEISKATFYLHYQDIYDLSEQLQQEAIRFTLDQITHPEDFLTNPMQFMQAMVAAFAELRPVTQILFSGSQSAILPAKIEEAYRDYFRQHFPQLQNNTHFQMFLTYQVYGAYYAYLHHADHFGRQEALDVLHGLSFSLTQSKQHRDAIAPARSAVTLSPKTET